MVPNSKTMLLTEVWQFVRLVKLTTTVHNAVLNGEVKKIRQLIVLHNKINEILYYYDSGRWINYNWQNRFIGLVRIYFLAYANYSSFSYTQKTPNEMLKSLENVENALTWIYGNYAFELTKKTF